MRKKQNYSVDLSVTLWNNMYRDLRFINLKCQSYCIHRHVCNLFLRAQTSIVLLQNVCCQLALHVTVFYQSTSWTAESLRFCSSEKNIIFSKTVYCCKSSLKYSTFRIIPHFGWLGHVYVEISIIIYHFYLWNQFFQNLFYNLILQDFYNK